MAGERIAQGAELRVRVPHALRRTGRARGEEHGREIGRRRRRQRARDRTRRSVARAQPEQVAERVFDPEGARQRGRQGGDRDTTAGPTECASGGEPGERAHDDGGMGAADGPAEAAHPEAGVRDDDDRADAHGGVEHGREVGRRRHEQAHPIAGPHAGSDEAVRELVDPAGELRPGDDACRAIRAGAHVDQRRRIAARVAFDRAHNGSLDHSQASSVRRVFAAGCRTFSASQSSTIGA